jgi:hypothetical protein
MTHFVITGDAISFEGRVVGTILPGLNPTLHDRVVDALESAAPGSIPSDEHEQVIKEMVDEHDADCKAMGDTISELEKERDRLTNLLNTIDAVGSGQALLELQGQLKLARESATAWRNRCGDAIGTVRKPIEAAGKKRPVKEHTALIAAAPDLLSALRFILAFYDPGQRHLDTEAWKQAEAAGRAAVKRATEGDSP